MSEDSQRLDIWLWRARFFKTRAEATKQISDKGVRVDRAGLLRKVTKPGSNVAIDDILTFRKAGDVRVIKVTGLPDRRGPAIEAQSHYEEVEQSED